MYHCIVYMMSDVYTHVSGEGFSCCSVELSKRSFYQVGMCVLESVLLMVVSIA